MKYLSLVINGTPIPTPEGLSGVENIGIRSLLSTGGSLLLFFVIILSLFFLIWGGIDIILAEGDKQRVASARQKLTFAVIGLVVALVSFLIVDTIGKAFGINLFNLP